MRWDPEIRVLERFRAIQPLLSQISGGLVIIYGLSILLPSVA